MRNWKILKEPGGRLVVYVRRTFFEISFSMYYCLQSPIEFVANNTVVPYKPQRTKQIRRSFNFPKKTADPLLCGDIIDTLYATHYAEEVSSVLPCS